MNLKSKEIWKGIKRNFQKMLISLKPRVRSIRVKSIFLLAAPWNLTHMILWMLGRFTKVTSFWRSWLHILLLPSILHYSKLEQSKWSRAGCFSDGIWTWDCYNWLTTLKSYLFHGDMGIIIIIMLHLYMVLHCFWVARIRFLLPWNHISFSLWKTILLSAVMLRALVSRCLPFTCQWVGMWSQVQS